MGANTVRRALKRLEDKGDLVRHYFGTRRDNDPSLFWVILTPSTLRHKAMTGELRTFTEAVRQSETAKRMAQSVGVHLRTNEETGKLEVTSWGPDEAPNFFDVEFLDWERQMEEHEDDAEQIHAQGLLLRAHAQRIVSQEDSAKLVERFETEHGHQPWAQELRDEYPELFRKPD